jgi:type IV pilus assembly protein PilA
VHFVYGPGGNDRGNYIAPGVAGMRRERGFTIIELMIVVTIIGIISALAIPVYQSYVTRAKIVEALQVVRPIQIAVSERYATAGQWPADNAAANLAQPAELRGRYVRSVEVVAGVITVTFGDPALANQTVTLTPAGADNEVVWACTSTLPAHLKPRDCS